MLVVILFFTIICTVDGPYYAETDFIKTRNDLLRSRKKILFYFKKKHTLFISKVIQVVVISTGSDLKFDVLRQHIWGHLQHQCRQKLKLFTSSKKIEG